MHQKVEKRLLELVRGVIQYWRSKVDQGWLGKESPEGKLLEQLETMLALTRLSEPQVRVIVGMLSRVESQGGGVVAFEIGKMAWPERGNVAHHEITALLQNLAPIGILEEAPTNTERGLSYYLSDSGVLLRRFLTDG